jgi:hypothetical protein
VPVSGALKRFRDDEVTITVLPIVPTENGAQLADLLEFTDLRLVVFS